MYNPFGQNRRMSNGLQEYNLGAMISNNIRDQAMPDIHSLMDRTLTYGENKQNIARQLGIATRDRGREQFEQQQHERQREHDRRAADPFRQTGQIQNQHKILIDSHFQAMRPGKRFSADGKRYYERRANRSDKGAFL